MDKPAELSSSQLYNFHIDLKNSAQGKKITIEDFKKKLVTTLKLPLTGAEFDAGKKQQLITQVTVYVTIDPKGKITSATFRKQLAKENSKQYTARQANNETHLEGTPTLTPAQEETAFTLLLSETKNASPFDSIENGKNIHNAVRELAPELNLKKKK